jgi:hypothetical protein
MTPVEIEVSSTRQSVAEAVVLTRRRYYWLRTMFGASYHVYLLIPGFYLGWLGLRGFLFYTSGPTRDWPYAFICAGLAAIPLVLGALIARDVRNELRSRSVTYGQVKFTFTDDGISGADDTGFTFADRWAKYDGFHVGRYVIVCSRVDSPAHLRIPTQDLPASRRDEIRSLLSSHLAELSREALRSRAGGR